jgi:hypothetical protein
LARPVATTVVVTHHGPHRGSVHPRYQNALTGGFVSACEDLILQAGRICGCTATPTIAPTTSSARPG